MTYYTGCYLSGWLIHVAKPQPTALQSNGWEAFRSSGSEPLVKALLMLPLLEALLETTSPLPAGYEWAELCCHRAGCYPPALHCL